MTVAAEQITTASRTNVSRFINAPHGEGNIYSSNVLSFIYDASSPLQRDRYHGIYHLTPLLMHGLFENRKAIAIIEDPRDFTQATMATGDRVYFANFDMARRPPWQKGNVPVNIENFLMVAGDIETIQLELNNGVYEREDNDGSYVMFIPTENVGPSMPVISQGVLATSAAAALFGDLQGRRQLEAKVVIIRALCQTDACSYQ